MTHTSIDLHVHSTASDGTFTPTQLVRYAISRGLAAFALTDHDSVAGLNEAMSAAAGTPLEVIRGIEFSTVYQGSDVHIVGLDIDPAHPDFSNRLHQFLHSRETRNLRMIEKMQKDGMIISLELLQKHFGDTVLTRAHIARFLMEAGYVSQMSEAFDRFLSPGCPYYIEREKVTPADAVQLICSTGGIPILAHPILYHFTDEKLHQLIVSLKKMGLMGIEAIYSTYSVREEAYIRDLAAELDLCISGGSDFHGDNKPGLDLGCGYGHLDIPYSILDTLRERRKNYED